MCGLEGGREGVLERRKSNIIKHIKENHVDLFIELLCVNLACANDP